MRINHEASPELQSADRVRIEHDWAARPLQQQIPPRCADAELVENVVFTACDASWHLLSDRRGCHPVLLHARLHAARLDDIHADLTIDATCITRSENNILYQFSVSAAGQLLLEGRAAVVLDADAISRLLIQETPHD